MVLFIRYKVTISQRVKSGMANANANAKGKLIGRPVTTIEDRVVISNKVKEYKS